MSSDFTESCYLKVGDKEMCVGGAYVWPRHSNIIVSDGTGSSDDVLHPSEMLSGSVMKEFDLRLERGVFYFSGESV